MKREGGQGKLGSSLVPKAKGQRQRRNLGRGMKNFLSTHLFSLHFPSGAPVFSTDFYNKLIGSNGNGNKTLINLLRDLSKWENVYS